MNSNTQIKLFKLMERVWLVGVVLGIAGVIYFLITKDNDSALYFFGFFILSSVLYLLRKKQRKRHESYLEQNKK
ncbi:MAG: hypothetical protein LCH32_02810 [Bacteroidetes bacterium]|jgi:uncharacterized membrane protein YfcA|nr:hypothetical protein [Bacteroidota bacterium]